MPREGVVATIRVSGGRGRGGGMEEDGVEEGGMVGLMMMMVGKWKVLGYA